MQPFSLTYPTAAVLLAIQRGHRYGFDIMDATGLPDDTVYPILFGFFPLLRYGVADLAGQLREGSARRATGGKSRGRLRNGLVIVQMALALVLLVGSGLMFRSSQALRAMDPGFDAEKVLTARITIPSVEMESWEETAGFFRQLRERLLAQGGVEVGYLEAMGIDLLQGRTFQSGDGAEGSRAVIVTQSFAEHWWPNESPLGRRMRLGFPDEDWYQIVGVVADAHYISLEQAPDEMVYWPAAVGPAESPQPTRSIAVVMKTSTDPRLRSAHHGRLGGGGDVADFLYHGPVGSHRTGRSRDDRPAGHGPGDCRRGAWDSSRPLRSE